MLELIGLVSLLIRISTAGKIIEFRANETYNDILCLPYTLWEQQHVISDMKCVRYCQRDGMCRGNSFSDDTKFCYGYSETGFNLSMCVDAAGYRFFAKEEYFSGSVLGTTTEKTTVPSSTSGSTGDFIVGIGIHIAIQPTANAASEAVTVGLSAWSFRLVNGTASTNGRVEVYHGGSWGHLCDYYFTNVQATKICRGLGLSQIGLPVYSGYFGDHEGPYVLQQFDCTDDLKSCQEAFWMTGEACNSIAVDCSNSFDFRLVGDTDPLEGRVEIRVVGEWGTVCAMDLHGSNTQDLLCQAAGFSNSSYIGNPITVYPVGSGPIWLQSVYCDPTSETIHDCTIGESPSCTHAFDASLFC